MRLTHRRPGLVLFFMLAFTLVGFRAPAAQAASGNGALVIDFQVCDETYEGNTDCFVANGVVNQTMTASGNMILVSNVRYSYTTMDTDGNVVYQLSADEHFRSLTMDDLLQQFSTASRYSDGTCTSSYAFHEANGQIQFNRAEHSCSVE